MNRSIPQRHLVHAVVAAVVAPVVGVAMVIVASPASAVPPGDIVLVSTSDGGVKGNDWSFRPSLSATGGAVAFESNATNLHPDDTDFDSDVYVKNPTSGEIVLASTSDAGVNGNGESQDPVLSGDGTTVAFFSSATNYDPGDTNPDRDLYVKDLATGDIVLASASDTGVKANRESTGPALSADGTVVAFQTLATNLDPGDTDESSDIYVKNLSSGDIVLASTSDLGQKGNSSSQEPALSSDGTAVAFDSFATNLDPADQDNDFDVYVKVLATGDITLASTSASGVKSNGLSSEAALSADGKTVAFRSSATNLDPADRDTSFDAYAKDLVSGSIALASTSDNGRKSNGDCFNVALSGDGNTLAFLSDATNLDPVDSDTRFDVYVKRLVGDDILVANTSDAGVKANGESLSLALSADATRIAFDSFATNLDPADSDPSIDVYVKTLMRPVTVSIRNHSVTEGDSGPRLSVFPVTLTAASPVPVTIDYATVDGTATAGTDYNAKSGTLTLQPGRTRAAITIVVRGDTAVERDETFTVELTGASGAAIADGRAVGTIRNDD